MQAPHSNQVSNIILYPSYYTFRMVRIIGRTEYAWVYYIEAEQSLYFTTPTGGLNSTKTNLAEDMSSEAANLIGSLSRHTEDSLDIENLNIESRQNLYGPELDIRPLEIPGAVIN